MKTVNLDVKLSVIQGMKDKLVSPDNAAYADAVWRPNFKSVEIIQLPEEGHFLPWRQVDLIVEQLRRMASEN